VLPPPLTPPSPPPLPSPQVRDTYVADEYLIAVTTDRQSAFDRNLGRGLHSSTSQLNLSRF